MTDQVKRWSRHGYGGMITDDNGEYVTFTDYDQLRAERDAMRGMLDEFIDMIVLPTSVGVMSNRAADLMSRTHNLLYNNGACERKSCPCQLTPPTQGDRDDKE